MTDRGETEATVRAANGLIARLLPLLLIIAMLALIYRSGLSLMWTWWSNKPEYNHGFLIPVVALYLLLLRAPDFQLVEKKASWAGLVIILAGLLGFLVGELSAIYAIIQYSFLICLWGIVLASVGWQALKVLWVPLAYLFFMVPLPNFLYNNLSSELQLISSELGVLVVRAAGVSVFLEGNVIDLGAMQLQVAEACNGLRYLFPLMSFGFLCASLYHGKVWHKVVIFLSTIPITILMNSFRIGIIGILVEHYGLAMARGFLHDFEGWAIFMACVGLLFLEMWLISLASGRKLSEVFDVEVPSLSDIQVFLPSGKPGPAVVSALMLLVVGGAYSLTLTSRDEVIPDRQALSTFPLVINDWRGREQGLESAILDELKVDDYLVAIFSDSTPGLPVELYVAYYDSQRKGASVHSPKACLPGGGWRIESMDEFSIDGALVDDRPLTVNRAVIEQGDERQLIYYWFPQRGRYLTNEYLVKWYIFWDSLTKHRTDGALVRLATYVPENASLEEADLRLQAFAREIDPQLSYYLPQAVIVKEKG